MEGGRGAQDGQAGYGLIYLRKESICKLIGKDETGGRMANQRAVKMVDAYLIPNWIRNCFLGHSSGPSLVLRQHLSPNSNYRELNLNYPFAAIKRHAYLKS